MFFDLVTLTFDLDLPTWPRYSSFLSNEFQKLVLSIISNFPKAWTFFWGGRGAHSVNFFLHASYHIPFGYVSLGKEKNILHIIIQQLHIEYDGASLT